jgi:hypothetical protein
MFLSSGVVLDPGQLKQITLALTTGSKGVIDIITKAQERSERLYGENDWHPAYKGPSDGSETTKENSTLDPSDPVGIKAFLLPANKPGQGQNKQGELPVPDDANVGSTGDKPFQVTPVKGSGLDIPPGIKPKQETTTAAAAPTDKERLNKTAGASMAQQAQALVANPKYQEEKKKAHDELKAVGGKLKAQFNKLGGPTEVDHGIEMAVKYIWDVKLGFASKKFWGSLSNLLKAMKEDQAVAQKALGLGNK